MPESGAHATIAPGRWNASTEIRKLTGAGADVAGIGNPAVQAQTFSSLRTGGRFGLSAPISP
jgi:hypothetical protein